MKTEIALIIFSCLCLVYGSVKTQITIKNLQDRIIKLELHIKP